MLQGGNLHYEVAGRTGAMSCGGLGAMHTLAQRLGLVKEIDDHLRLLKVHLPYHESDHLLNVAYNILAGGVRLEDLELRRQDEHYMNGLGAQRIPDPTTAGDFTRRFAPADILTLQECINRTRQWVWSQQPEGFLAEALPASAWHALERMPKHEILTEPRTKPVNVKERIVQERGYTNIVLQGEDVAEISYQPLKCKKSYRLVVVRKNLSVQKGENVLFDEVRYFFYITKREDLMVEEVVGLANQRCNQENLIAQLKGPVQAMRMPVNDLNSNWAYMVMAALAWNLKAWFALLVPERERGIELLKMEFRTFLQAIMQLPAQIVRTARKLIYRVLGYNQWLKDLLATFERLRHWTASG